MCHWTARFPLHLIGHSFLAWDPDKLPKRKAADISRFPSRMKRYDLLNLNLTYLMALWAQNLICYKHQAPGSRI